MATKTNVAAKKVPAVEQKKTAPKTSTELAVRKNHSVAIPEEMAASFAEDAGKGMSNVDADSLAIPFLAVLQSNSPQCDPDSGEYLEDAKPGMLYNTVTKELFDGREGVNIVPCEYQRKFLRWAPRETGGGFKGEYRPEEVVKMREQGILIEQDNRLYVPDDNGNVNPKKNDKVADTRVHFCLLLNPETGVPQQVVLSLSSTQIKKSKQLMSLLGNVLIDGPNGKLNPPTFANVVKLTTVPESNEKGKWSGVKMELDGLVRDSATYAAAKSFHSLIRKGGATVAYESAAGNADNDDAGDGRF